MSEVVRLNKKQDPTIWCLQKINFKYKDPERLKEKGCKRHTILT